MVQFEFKWTLIQHSISLSFSVWLCLKSRKNISVKLNCKNKKLYEKMVMVRDFFLTFPSGCIEVYIIFERSDLPFFHLFQEWSNLKLHFFLNKLQKWDFESIYFGFRSNINFFLLNFKQFLETIIFFFDNIFFVFNNFSFIIFFLIFFFSSVI